MLSRTSDDVKGEECRQSFSRARGVDKYKGKSAIRVDKGGKHKVEG